MVGGKNTYNKKPIPVEIANEMYKSLIEILLKMQKEKLDSVVGLSSCLSVFIDQGDIVITIYLYKCMMQYFCSESSVLRAINVFLEKLRMDEKFRNLNIISYREKDKYIVVLKRYNEQQ